MDYQDSNIIGISGHIDGPVNLSALLRPFTCLATLSLIRHPKLRIPLAHQGVSGAYPGAPALPDGEEVEELFLHFIELQKSSIINLLGSRYSNIIYTIRTTMSLLDTVI